MMNLDFPFRPWWLHVLIILLFICALFYVSVAFSKSPFWELSSRSYVGVSVLSTSLGQFLLSLLNSFWKKNCSLFEVVCSDGCQVGRMFSSVYPHHFGDWDLLQIPEDDLGPNVPWLVKCTSKANIFLPLEGFTCRLRIVPPYHRQCVRIGRMMDLFSVNLWPRLSPLIHSMRR